MCALTTVARSLCSSSNSAATAFSRDLELELCCIAAKILAFSLLGTRPNLTAVTTEGHVLIMVCCATAPGGWTRCWSRAICFTSADRYPRRVHRRWKLTVFLWNKSNGARELLSRGWKWCRSMGPKRKCEEREMTTTRYRKETRQDTYVRYDSWQLHLGFP